MHVAAVNIKSQTVYKPGSVLSCDRDGHSSGTFVAERLARPTRAAARRLARHGFGPCLPLLLGLAPGGVFPAIAITGNAVRSYRTISPLPPMPSHTGPLGLGGMFSVALSLGSPPPAVNRHRVSLEPGLSSLLVAEKSGHPTVWHGMIWADRRGLSKIIHTRRAAIMRPRCAEPAR
jgi:hypothetical protein